MSVSVSADHTQEAMLSDVPSHLFQRPTNGIGGGDKCRRRRTESVARRNQQEISLTLVILVKV